MTISIIIPTYNEANNIASLIQQLILNSNDAVIEIIISDGGSNDGTIQIAKIDGAIAVQSPVAGRAAQMNYGASIAKGDILYFIHADCYPPETYATDIEHAINTGIDLGRYRTKFNSTKKILKINEWFTRFDLFVCMGGDQTLFIKKSLFNKCNGFKDEMKIMEDYEFCERARKIGKYKILKGEVLVSDRKYNTNSWLNVQLANFKIVSMYKKGITQQRILDTYKSMLNYRESAGN